MSAGGPPSGVVTFLFTDIEGSTRRWEADAAAMRVALLAHDDVLHTAIEAHDGFLFSHTGDGVVAAFASPKAAVDAAIDAQRELELPVRMGIATGEAELRDGDYFGTVLNRAARVMAAGHGGQVLVADSTAVLLSGVELQNLGPRRLKDLPNPITIFQLNAPGLRTNFPALRTLDRNPGNLRPAATSFIGRGGEVANVQAALRAHRLVTLTGVGGVGKTRLALEAAAQLVGEFPDGVWVFELAAVTDPAAIPDAVAAVLSITQQPGMTVSESVAAALEGRVRLLVFDNCEHVLDATADLIGAILDRSTTVRILATSREGLSVANEQVWPVKSLDTVAAGHLFAERAYSVAPALSAEDEEAVTEICQRLDGIPLAIELAASRISSMTAVDVRDRLDQRFKLLVGTRRGVERHQTLRQAVQWSYDLLEDAEKALLARCSVFSGGFDVQSACAVAGFDDRDDFAVLDLLDALVRKSLLVTDRSTGRARYSMLETIRQFAEEQLASRGEADEARTAHASYFAGRQADILALWNSPRQRDAYTWFTNELANLRAAFRWAEEHRDLDSATPIAVYAALLGTFVENVEPITWVEELVEPARAVDHPGLTSLHLMATWCWSLGRVEEAIRYSEAGQKLLLSGRDAVPPGFESWLAGVFNVIGQAERTAAWSREMLATRPDPYALASSSLVAALMASGDHAEAVATAKRLVQTADAISNPWARTYAFLVYGMACCDSDPVSARDALRRGFVIAQESGNRYNESHIANVLGRLEAWYGDPLTAMGYLSLAIHNYHDSGSFTVMRVPLASLAALLHRIGRHEKCAIIAGYAFSPFAKNWVPELRTAITQLREALGDETYDTLAGKGKSMTASGIAAYAYDEIDHVRAELERSK
nr:adenylate/guanylate cyclase domain-containing protein [Mycobacterium sp. JS623]